MSLRFPICKMATIAGLLRGWQEFICVKHLEEYLAHSAREILFLFISLRIKEKPPERLQVTCSLKNDEMYTHEISGGWFISQRAGSLPAKLRIPTTPIQRKQKDPGQLFLHEGRFGLSLANDPFFTLVFLMWPAEEFLEESRGWVQIAPRCHWALPGILSFQEYLLPAAQNRALSVLCCPLASW